MAGRGQRLSVANDRQHERECSTHHGCCSAATANLTGVSEMMVPKGGIYLLD
jgi:hypothetical protein